VAPILIHSLDLGKSYSTMSREFAALVRPMNHCPCHRALLGPDQPHWWPLRDPEPGPEVRVVVLYGDHPDFLRMVRVPTGWHAQGAAAPHPDRTPPEPWLAVGRCWAGSQHPVINAAPIS